MPFGIVKILSSFPAHVKPWKGKVVVTGTLLWYPEKKGGDFCGKVGEMCTPNGKKTDAQGHRPGAADAVGQPNCPQYCGQSDVSERPNPHELLRYGG